MVSTSQSSAKSSLDFLKNLSENDIDRELCKRSFYYFLKTFWDTIIAEEFVDNWHIKLLCDELQGIVMRVVRREVKEYDLIINVPPGTSKSTIIIMMLPAWCWVLDSSLRLLTASYTAMLSEAHCMKSIAIMKSDKYQSIFPHTFKFKKMNEAFYSNHSGGERLATSVSGAATGIHAHIILVDDPLNAKQASSEAERRRANKFVTETLSTRKVDKRVTVTIVVMQRLHEDDTTGYMLAKGKDNLRHICLPAEVSDMVHPPELKNYYIDGLLDPVRLSPSVLAEAKKDLGSYGYAGQFDQRPAPDEGGIIKKAWFGSFKMTDLVDSEGRALNLVWNYPADTAFTKNEQNDPSGMLAYAFHNNNFYIRNVWVGWLEMPDLVRHLPKWAYENGYDNRSTMLIEPKANGISVVHTLRAGTNLNVIEGPAPTKDKIARTIDNSPIIESKRVFLLEGGAWVEDFLTEVSQFPNGKHDERVDLVNMMIDRHVNGKKILSISIV